MEGARRRAFVRGESRSRSSPFENSTFRFGKSLHIGLWNLEVTEAADGRQGLAQAGGQKFDLVITDLNMPVMDGIEMMTGMRKLPGYAFTPILMLTTESQPEKKDAGRKAGATGWIVKPFQAEQLIAVVQKLVR
jgi:two-component system chemotaxis response regulator CheY